MSGFLILSISKRLFDVRYFFNYMMGKFYFVTFRLLMNEGTIAR